MPELARESFISQKYGKFIEDAQSRMPENQRLVEALMANIGRIDRNRHNLEVLLSLARFAGHHWRLLNAFRDAEQMLDNARDASQKKNAQQAVSSMVTAYNSMDRVRKDGKKYSPTSPRCLRRADSRKERLLAGESSSMSLMTQRTTGPTGPLILVT